MGTNEIKIPFWVDDKNPPAATIEEIIQCTIVWKQRENRNMTPQEELFAEFFNHEANDVVKNMDNLTLEAHIEKLAAIAFEARARFQAADTEKKRRKKDGKPVGFQTSLQMDDISSEAINAVKNRQTKLTKGEKFIASMAKLGITEGDAQKLMSAGTILAHVKQKAGEVTISPIVNPFSKEKKEDIDNALKEAEQKTKDFEAAKVPVFNPFAKG